MAPSAAPHGNENDGGPDHDVPRTPAGPSDILIAGTGGSSIWAVCHTSAPAISATFCSTVSARHDPHLIGRRPYQRVRPSAGAGGEARLQWRREAGRDAHAVEPLGQRLGRGAIPGVALWR